ncbi:MAG: 2-iminobutanoate/2-iminopropanoate deaminase [Roseivirga sp.]|jgi:2-iminobutanoate/2-iminopropanoate deaminase
MKKIVNTTLAPAPIGPYSQAVIAGNILYTSGQIAINPQSGLLEIEDIKSETNLVMKNLAAVLKAAGTGFSSIIKCTIFIKDMNQFADINSVYGSYFNEDAAPARETVEVARLPKDVNVEISAIALIGE